MLFWSKNFGQHHYHKVHTAVLTVVEVQKKRFNGRFDVINFINERIISTGKRPFGVSILYMGWDKHYGYQLYQSDPSGNYGGWKATCIGNNSAVSSFYIADNLIINIL